MMPPDLEGYSSSHDARQSFVTALSARPDSAPIDLETFICAPDRCWNDPPRDGAPQFSFYYGAEDADDDGTACKQEVQLRPT
jgi:hypothetical protein